VIHQILNSYKSVIVLNGRIEVEMLSHYIRKASCIIAADGAANILAHFGIEPDYIIGDFDSLEQVNWTDKCLLFEDQNSTDFEKAIGFAKFLDVMPALVVGVNGGEMDHVMGNMHIMMKHSLNRNLFFIDAQTSSQLSSVLRWKLGLPLVNETFEGHLKIGSTLSLLPFPKAICSSSGLNWELDNQTLEINGMCSLRNLVKSSHVKILVSGHCFLMIDA
jgi:thiamine pyrophosphokinase